MSRIRTIKPEFFKHEDLYELEKELLLPVRLAYAGLWTCADREGRFRWQPRRLKTDILPYDDCDFSRVLDALATRGFVQKYELQGEFFGWIPSWKEHQFINNKEPQTRLPDPSNCQIIQQVDASATRESREEDATLTRGVKEGKGKGSIKPSTRSTRGPVSRATQKTMAEGQSKHKRVEEMIKAAWQDHNLDAGKCPWGESDGKQLKNMLAKTASWPDTHYAQCLANLYATDGLPSSELPFQFLPRLPGYFSGPKDRYNRNLISTGVNQNGPQSTREQRNAANATQGIGEAVTELLGKENGLRPQHVPQPGTVGGDGKKLLPELVQDSHGDRPAAVRGGTGSGV